MCGATQTAIRKFIEWRCERNKPETGLEVHSAQKSVRENGAKQGKERQHWYRVRKEASTFCTVRNQNVLKSKIRSVQREMIKNIEYS